MLTGFSLRQKPAIGISEAVTRRLQMACWSIVLLLAVGSNLRMMPELMRDSLQLAELDLTPDEQATLRQHVEPLGISIRTLTFIGLAGAVIQEITVAVISAALLIKRKGTDWFAFYLSLTMIAGIGAMYPPALHDLVDGEIFWLAAGKALTGLAVTSLFLIPFLFPTGRFVPRWMIVPAAFMVYGVLAFVIRPSDDAGGDLSPALETALNIGMLLFMMGSIVYRYRNTATIVQRQQMKWGVAGASVAFPAFLVGDALMRNIDETLTGVLSMIGWSVAMPLASLVFPLCLTIAILRYRLWEIDLIVSRTLVWALMTALVVAAYVGIVLGIGSFLQQDHSTALGLIVLGLTAVLFQPARAWVQQAVNRLLFGERDDPYRVVRALADDLAETVQPIDALHATVRTLTNALRLPYAAIVLEPGSAPVAMAGNPGGIEYPIPLSYQAQPVGELIVSPRSGSREFDHADRTLLDDLARQIGMVAHNVRLTSDLQASRERIVTAREEERRRLRRDLHDGLGAQLAALNLHAGALKATIHADPEAAVAQATELQHELRTAVTDVRRLVQGLRPAALDDLGLIGALSARITTVNLSDWAELGRNPLSVELNAPSDLGVLPAAVEVALYRIVEEALANVVRHANASRCQIAIARNASGIRLSVEDDGEGIPVERVSGVGLQSMRERAQELGGTLTIEAVFPSGTRIVAELPVSGDGGSPDPQHLFGEREATRHLHRSAAEWRTCLSVVERGSPGRHGPPA